MIRLAHISDIHLSAPHLDWELRDWFSKRVTSWMNHRLFGRVRRFALAETIIVRLMDELRERGVDRVVFSGDATALGFESEIQRAAELLRIGGHLPGLAIPGNHDYCTRNGASSGAFERHFAPWQEGRRIGDHRYPFAQQVGPAWLIGVNAATGNVWPWDAGGRVGIEQLDRLRELLNSLGPGLKILVLHFPVCLAGGVREPAHHGVRDLEAVLEVAHAGGVNLWLHGHRHSAYYLQTPTGASFPVICAGSTTQRGLWSYGEYVIDDRTLRGTRRAYDPETNSFRDVETFALTLG